jgi:hypothetical protein
MGWRRTKRYRTADKNEVLKVVAALFIIAAVVIAVVWFNTLGQEVFRSRIELR